MIAGAEAVSSPRRQDSEALPAPLRLILVLSGGIILYVLIILNFDIYKDSLHLYTYKISFHIENIPVSIALICIVSAIFSLSIPKHQSVIGMFSHLVYIIIFIPLCSIYTIMDGDIYFLLICSLSISICYLIFGRQKYLSSNSEKTNFDKFIFLVFSSALLINLVIMVVNGDIVLNFVSFNDVYRLRSAAAHGEAPIASRWTTIIAYTASSYVIIYGLNRRNIISLVIGSANLYILYNSYGYKLFIFFIFLNIGLYLFYKLRNPYLLLYSIIILMALSNIFYFFGTPYVHSIMNYIDELIIRRYFYVPGYMSYAWFDTFKEYPYIYMSNEFMVKEFIKYPLDINHSLFVARNIFGMDFNPNTNFMAYGFANFGYIGVIIYSLIVYSSFLFVDVISYKTGSSYLRLGALAPATLFLEADPLVVLISFGFGFILIISLAARLLAMGERREILIRALPKRRIQGRPGR